MAAPARRVAQTQAIYAGKDHRLVAAAAADGTRTGAGVQGFEVSLKRLFQNLLVQGSVRTSERLQPRVCRDYQCLYDEFGGFKGVSRCAAYVIDREGTICYRYICPDPRDLPDFEKIKQCLREIK
jgi:hypothetical protein